MIARIAAGTALLLAAVYAVALAQPPGLPFATAAHAPDPPASPALADIEVAAGPR